MLSRRFCGETGLRQQLSIRYLELRGGIVLSLWMVRWRRGFRKKNPWQRKTSASRMEECLIRQLYPITFSDCFDGPQKNTLRAAIFPPQL
ncbi:hypothetical protein TNCV_2540581 [Trichonephila clavipes]|nr:hypothetical protein TNCV_2540581 [Trichonephila clavipes]